MILAAGKGTRMNSGTNKVLHTLLGIPMVAYPVACARGLGAAPIVVVLGHQIADVVKALDDRFGPGVVAVVEQEDQKGTGHAVRLGLDPLQSFDGLVVVLYGDVPLLRAETLADLVDRARKSRGLAMLTSVVRDPTGYGRIVRDDAGKICRGGRAQGHHPRPAPYRRGQRRHLRRPRRVLAEGDGPVVRAQCPRLNTT